MNDSGTIQRNVEDIAARVATDRGLALVEVAIGGAPGMRHVRVFLDRVGGIGLLDLQEASREISALLDAEDPIKGRYTLEVSSPGVDRPLKTPADLARAMGRPLTVQLARADDGPAQVTGVLREVTAQTITLEAETGPRILPLPDIASARLELGLPRRTQGKQDKRARRVHG